MTPTPLAGKGFRRLGRVFAVGPAGRPTDSPRMQVQKPSRTVPQLVKKPKDAKPSMSPIRRERSSPACSLDTATLFLRPRNLYQDLATPLGLQAKKLRQS